MARIQLKNKPENIDDAAKRIEAICKFTRPALEARTVSELRELGAFLIPHARKLNKSQFIDALLEISEPYRQERLNQTLAHLDLMGDIDISRDLIKKGFTKNISSKEMAEIITNKLKAGGYTDSTLGKTKPKQLRILLDSLELEDSTMGDYCNEIYSLVREFAKKHDNATNIEYSKKVDSYGNTDQGAVSLIKLDGTKILSWARDTINWAASQENLLKGWHKVSFALALTSGRRMDEIHGDTQYEVVDESTLRAIGLSKKKQDDFVHEFPCLIDAYTWLSVLNKLPENRRNQPNSVVNQTICRAISESIETTLNTLGFYKIKDGVRQKGTYKDARDFYVAYLIATKHNRSMHGSEISFAKKLLGHESKKQTLSYDKMYVEIT